MENLMANTPYNFKNSYGGTPEPQTPQDAPWLRGPSFKKYMYSDTRFDRVYNLLRQIQLLPLRPRRGEPVNFFSKILEKNLKI
jgi:hypothetical protein